MGTRLPLNKGGKGTRGYQGSSAGRVRLARPVYVLSEGRLYVRLLNQRHADHGDIRAAAKSPHPIVDAESADTDGNVSVQDDAVQVAQRIAVRVFLSLIGAPMDIDR